MLGSSSPDPRIGARPNTRILPWRPHGNTFSILWYLLTNVPDVYFFPREGKLDAAFLAARRAFALKTALVTYVISGGLLTDNRPLLFRAIREADVVVGNSRHMTEIATKLGGHDVHTIYDGIDRRYYYPNPNQPNAQTSNRVLYAGSFRRYKRADLVVQEATRFPRWEFRLAGKGEEEDACRKLAQASNCKKVQFLGHLSAAQLGEEMRQAQLFFFPSAIEGHPQVLGQAAACGLPCIARRSYHPDYVVDGVTGLLADSEEQLSVVLAQLIRDSDLRSRMCAAAIMHATRFEWADITEQWQQIFETAVLQRKGGRRKRVS